MHASAMLPFADNLTIITPPKIAQFSVHEAVVQKSSFWFILEIKGESSNLWWVVSNMHQAKTVHAHFLGQRAD